MESAAALEYNGVERAGMRESISKPGKGIEIRELQLAYSYSIRCRRVTLISSLVLDNSSSSLLLLVA
jgi:hypothetical protein